MADDDAAPIVDGGSGAPASDATSVPVPTVESKRERLTRYAKGTKARADTLVQQASERMERIEAERDRRPFVDFVLSIRDDDDRIGGRELAAAVAYRLFFLLLPLVLVLVAGLGLTGASSRGAAEDAVRSSGTSAAVAHSIADATGELSIFEHLTILAVGLFATYFAVRGLKRTLVRVNASAWQIQVRKTATTARAIGVVLGLIVALVLVSREWNEMRGQLGALEFLLALPVVGAIYGALVTALHAQLPRPDAAPWTRLIPGALLVGMWVAVLQAFVLGYIAHKLSSSSELYGGVGTAIVVLLWLYLVGRALVIGPVLDGVLWRRQQASAVDHDAAGSP